MEKRDDMGVYSAKTLVMGCLLANILTIATTEGGSSSFVREAYRDDIAPPYCQFKGACFLEPSTVHAQFIESEPTTDEQRQTVVYSCDRSLPLEVI